jgi:hypothetical protein
MVERVIPALVAATAAMEESAQITRQIAEERERELRRRLDRTGATE